MLEEAEEMIAGARILSKVLGGAKVIFWYRGKQNDAIEVIKKAG